MRTIKWLFERLTRTVSFCQCTFDAVYIGRWPTPYCKKHRHEIENNKGEVK